MNYRGYDSSQLGKSVKFTYLYPSFIHLSLLTMLTDLLQTSYFAIFLIVPWALCSDVSK